MVQATDEIIPIPLLASASLLGALWYEDFIRKTAIASEAKKGMSYKGHSIQTLLKLGFSIFERINLHF